MDRCLAGYSELEEVAESLGKIGVLVSQHAHPDYANVEVCSFSIIWDEVPESLPGDVCCVVIPVDLAA